MASTATSHDDMDPQPRVDLVIDPVDLDVATDTITVLQMSKWGQLAVRSASRRSVTGGFAVTDYEVPPGVPVTYRVEQFDAAGVSLGYALLDLPARVDIPVGWAVISDPLAPGNAVLLRAESQFAGALKRSRATSFYSAGFDTIALSGLQTKLQDVVLRCVTESEQDRAALETITSVSMLVVRTMPQMRLPGSLYAVVPEVVMDPFDAHVGGDTDVWDLVGQEVSRPALDIIVPVYTWQDIIDYYATWSALIADRATWLDVIRNPPPSA